MSSLFTAQLSALPLRRTADPGLRKAMQSGDHADFQRAMVKNVAKLCRRLDKALDKHPLASLWSADSLVRTDADRKLHAALVSAKADGTNVGFKTVCESLAAGFADANGPRTVFETLVAAELMLRYATSFTSARFAQVYLQLAVTDIHKLSSASPPNNTDASGTVLRLVAEGELPFVLSRLFESLPCSKVLRPAAIECLAQCLEQSTDTDGSLHAAISHDVRQWLAPFVRVAAWSKASGQPWGRKGTLARWSDCLEGLAAVTVSGGFITDRMADVESPVSTRVDGTTLLARAVDLTEFSPGSALPSIVKSLTRRSNSRKTGKPSKKHKEPNANRQSDWAATAVLRNTFDADADIIFLDWEGPRPGVRLAALGTRIFHGDWDSRITVDGRPQQTVGNWVCTCWFEDEAVAFAELEAGAADGLRHVRQVMLASTEHFAIITDTVTCPERDSEIEFESRLHLLPSFAAESNPITRDLRLSDGYLSARAIPAWLEDDRVHHASGNCSVVDSNLVLQARNHGGVTVPLVLDWHPERQSSEPDWNRLTVTEERRVNTTHEASGFRVRTGSLQLLLYRSLRRGETLRAVLGHHTSNETVYGHVRNSGKIAPLVMVESEA